MNSPPCSGLSPAGQEGPAGEHVGEADDVVLGVDGAHTQRMQLQDLAREVLVEAAGAIDAGDRVRAHRRRLVEVEEHRRMALGGLQHVGEAPEDVGADGLALVGTGHALDLVGRDAEMVRPEPHQPLGKADLGGERRIDARLRLVEIDLPPGVGNGLGRRLAAMSLAACSVPSAMEGAAAAAPPPPSARARRRSAGPAARRWRRRRCGRPARSTASPAAAISPCAGLSSSASSAPRGSDCDGRDRSWARPHAEAMQRKRRLGLRGMTHREYLDTDEVGARS